MRYILASSSPRRKELMKEISSVFIVDAADVDESVDAKLSPEKAVRVIAKRKGEVIHHKYPHDIVIAADTIVVINNTIIGKPKDEKDAKRILKLLSGKTHHVYTAYVIMLEDKIVENMADSTVKFNVLSDELIENYIASKSPLDKAGAYGVQDNDEYPIIDKIEGSIKNVIGFPVDEIKESLKEII